MTQAENIEGQTVGFRLSPHQESLWQLGPLSAGYRAYCALDVGSNNVAQVRKAVEAVVNRHEILRTTFVRQAGLRLPSQVICDSLPPAWNEQAWDGSTADSVALAALVRAEAAEPIDLEHGPVLRALLVSGWDGRTLLVLTAPSVCADATSLVVVAREITSLLAGAAELGELLQYADFAEWRHELGAGDDEDAEAARRYWSEQELVNADAPIVLFGTAPDSASDFVPERIPIEVDAQWLLGVERAATGLGSSAPIFLETAWHAVVARFSGDSGVVIPTLVEGRAHAELTDAVGVFAEYVPVRTRIDEETSFAEALDQVRRARAEAERWQDYESAAEMRAISERLPIRFAARATPAAVGDLTLVAFGAQLDRFALELSMWGEGSDLALELAYDPQAYDHDDAERVAAAFVALASHAAMVLSTSVADLRLLDDSERERLSVEWNQTEAEIPSTCIHAMFEEQAERTPARAAVSAGGVELSYTELNARANQVAHHLRQEGVGRGSAVGLCMDRSTDMVVALLGILKAGGAYVPLNFEHPAARLAHQLEETEAAVLISQEPLLERLPSFDRHVLCLDRDRGLLDAQPTDDPERVNEPRDLVYVMYTSGSTGVPKGVGVTHRNLVNYTNFVIRTLGADEAPEGLRFGVVSAISTDLGNTCVFPSITSGGCLHLVSPEASMDGVLFAEEAERAPLDVLKITPSHLGALLTGAGDRSVLPRRWLVVGGEASSWDLIDRVSAAGSCRILNHYGPTETTVGSCTFEIGTDVSKWRPATVPVGRPITNTRVYVVDRNLEPVPVGVPGELCIGGAGVSEGYVGQLEQTAAVFVPDPFASDPAARLYRTGDRARLLPEGSVEFLGRTDLQVKIRGYRVEPSEVELVLEKHEAVRQVAVVAHEDGHGDARLIAYIVTSEQPAAEELQSFLRESLPDFMVPSAFVPIEALPLTPSGKVDRRALPDPATVQAQRETEYVGPRTPLEEEIARIWAEVLGVERVGVTDDFFALGGHSLMATQIIARIRSEYVEIPLHSIFTAPTVESLAEVVLTASLEGASEAELLDLETAHEGEPA